MANYVSVASLQNPDILEERIAAHEPVMGWGLPLPAHIDTERLQVNMSRLGVLHGVGAFSASVVNEYQGKTTESVNISSINADGSAVAGKASTKQAEEFRSGLIEGSMRYMSPEHYGKPVVMHSVNRPEAVQNVISLKEDGRTDEQAWAKVLDTTVRESFRAAGRAHLVDRAGAISKGLSYAMAGFAFLGAIAAVETGDVQFIVPAYMGFHAFNLVTETVLDKKFTGQTHLRERRWSLFLDNQLDRYVALNGLSRLPGLIKVQK